MNVLSLFDGMSCGQIALGRAGIDVGTYYASELDKYAITVTQSNYPDTVQLGDVLGWREWDIDWSSIDLLIGGSPCQGFSFAGKQLAFDDPRSKLFFVYVDILNHIRTVNPDVKFMLENVKMKAEYLDIISAQLGVDPVFINSSLVSAQNRQRYYWASWDFTAPVDREIYLSSILEELPDCPIGYAVREKSKCVRRGGMNSPFGDRHEWDSSFQRVSKRGKVKPGNMKAACLTGGGHSGGNHSDMDIIHSPTATRRYSILECERLQTVPDNYTSGASNTQRYKMLGNGWTVDVVAEIFNSLKEPKI